MRELLDRLEAEDWTAAVDHFSPAYVEAEVASILQSVRPKRRLPTVDGLLKADPAMPRDVATYEVDRARRAPPPNPFYGDLYGVDTEEDLEGMDSAEIYARYLHGRDHRWRWRAHVRALMDRHPEYRKELEDQLTRTSSPWSGEVLGQVVDGSRAYVLFGRRQVQTEESQVDFPPSVAVFRRLEDAWRLSSDIVPGYATMFGPVRVPDQEGGWITLT